MTLIFEKNFPSILLPINEMHPNRPYEQDGLVGEDFPLSNTKSTTSYFHLSYRGETLTNQCGFFGTFVCLIIIKVRFCLSFNYASI